jgi:hypothetical protein
MANVPEHIAYRRINSMAALPGWAAGKFPESQACVIRAVGVEMLDNHGVCTLSLKAIADAAHVSDKTARSALKTAEAIGLLTVERRQGSYNMHSRTPEWPLALRRLIERAEALTHPATGP